MPVSLTVAIANLADEVETDEWPPRPLPSERTAADMAVNPFHVAVTASPGVGGVELSLWLCAVGWAEVQDAKSD